MIKVSFPKSECLVLGWAVMVGITVMCYLLEPNFVEIHLLESGVCFSIFVEGLLWNHAKGVNKMATTGG